MKRVSFIIPCYNVEKYVAGCLNSVLVQSVTDWEAICVNDGSKDGTLFVLEEYAKKDARIKVISQENGGLSAARNTALKVAQGQWLYYLDSDDVIAPWALEGYLKAAELYPDADLINAGKVDFEDDGTPKWEKPKNFSFSLEDISKTVGRSPFTGFFPQFLFKKETVGMISFVGESWCEERPYVAKCVARCKLIVWCNFDAYGYRIRPGSICQSGMTLSQCMGFLDATRTMLYELKNSGKTLRPDLIRILQLSWMEYSSYQIVTRLTVKDRPVAWKHWFDSLPELCQYHPQTPWLRFVLNMCIVFPCRITACLCILPHWLKTKGFHR